MKTIDLSSLISLDKEYGELADLAEKHYKCDWDDQVHDSYLKYLNQVKEQALKTHEIQCDLEILDKEIEKLMLEDVQNKARSLCREADSI